MSRAIVMPPTERLIHLIGDTHHGDLNAVKSAKALADLDHRLVPEPVIHLQVGDLAENGNSLNHRTTALAWMNSLPTEWVCALGNHDIVGNDISPEAVAALYGMTGPSFVRDLDFARIIVLSPVPFWDLTNLPAAIGVSQDTLDFLAASLDSAPNDVPCLVVCHAPLYNTVAGGSTVGYSSTSTQFHVYGPNLTDDTEVRTVLDAHANAKAWICGHTHTQIDTAGLFTTVNVGSRSVAHINCSSIHYTGGLNSAPPTDAYKKLWTDASTVWLNVFDDRFELRIRNHGAGVWYGPNGSRVTTIAIPA